MQDQEIEVISRFFPVIVLFWISGIFRDVGNPHHLHPFCAQMKFVLEIFNLHHFYPVSSCFIMFYPCRCCLETLFMYQFLDFKTNWDDPNMDQALIQT